MNFNAHSHLTGKHSFLSASKYHWINYDIDKLTRVYLKQNAAVRGTRLHNFAQECIELGVKLPRTNDSLNQFVNDAIGFRMRSEQILFYSPNVFGTADGISFIKNFLRIHDYKSGEGRVSMKQLEVYASIFCLEYNHSPEKIEIELRIYQGGKILVHIPDPMEIRQLMDKIIQFDDRIEKIREVEASW